MKAGNRSFWIGYTVLVLLFLIRIVPFVYPNSRSWGFDHLIFLPEYLIIFFAILTGLALIFPFLKISENWTERLVTKSDYLLHESVHSTINSIILILTMGGLFVIFIAPTHFLGDSYILIKNLEKATGVYFNLNETEVFKWSEIGVSKFMILVRSIVGRFTDNDALLSFQIVSVLSGVITIWFFIKIAFISTENKIKRLLIFGASLLSPILLLFFGYAEYYHIIWAFQAAFIYLALKHIKTGAGLPAAWIVLIIGTAFHLQMALYIPAAVYLTFCTGGGNKIYNRFKTVVWILISLVCLVVVYAAIKKYMNDLYIQDMFLTLFTGKPVYPGYAIFTLPHLIDILNELILVTPLVFILLPIGLPNLKALLHDKRFVFLGLSAVGCLAFLLVIDPKLSMARDWDLFSLTPYSLLLLSIIILSKKMTNQLKRLIVPMFILLTVGTAPFLLTNLQTNRSVRYFEKIINLDIRKADYSLIVLADYYNSIGQPQKADSVVNVYSKHFPQVKQYNRIMAAMDRGDLKSADMLLDGVVPNKYDGDYQRVWGRYYYLKGDYVKALEYLNRAIQLRRYNSLYYWQRAMIYLALQKENPGHDDLVRAYELDNNSARVLDALAYTCLAGERYDSSIYYASRLVDLDSTQIGAYYLLAISYFQNGDRDNAGINATKFIQKTEGIVPYDRQRDEMLNMIKSIRGGASTR